MQAIRISKVPERIELIPVHAVMELEHLEPEEQEVNGSLTLEINGIIESLADEEDTAKVHVFVRHPNIGAGPNPNFSYQLRLKADTLLVEEVIATAYNYVDRDYR